MNITDNTATMLFKLKPTKFQELVNFIDIDHRSLVLLTLSDKVSSGAVFENINHSASLEHVS